MAQKSNLSVIVPARGVDRDDLVCALLGLDYYLSECKRDALEIVLTGEREDDFFIDGLRKLIPEVVVLAEDELSGNLKGDAVLVFKPDREISFDNFKKLMGVSLKKADIAVPYSGRKSFWVRFLDWKGGLLRKILRLKERVAVVRDSGVAFFKPEAAEGLPLFNLPAAVVFTKLSGGKVELVEMPDGNFSPTFSDYLKAWWGMVLFKFGECRKKRGRKQ